MSNKKKGLRWKSRPVLNPISYEKPIVKRRNVVDIVESVYFLEFFFKILFDGNE
jgi:hypothetical protein